MQFFDLFRELPYPTLYPPRKTAVTADVLEAGLLFCIIIITFSLLVIIPGVRGIERINYTIRVIISMFVMGCILFVNFGQEWEVAEIHDVPTQYRAGIVDEIHADIGLKIGLRSINITLKTDPEVQEFNNGSVKERINYNERFHWDDDGFAQGRMGFGPFAGLFNREYRAAQLKGLPYPILWIAEYFTIDGEFIRWGRFYRQAGYYAHTMVWLAFPLWILSLILFKLVILYGGIFSLMTGLSLICANLIYAFVRNPIELVIPFTDEKKLDTHFGWCFWLCLFNGILTILIGIVVIVMNEFFDDLAAKFMNFDIAQDTELFYGDASDSKNITRGKTMFHKFTKKKSSDENANHGASTSNIEMLESGAFNNPKAGNSQQMFRKRTMGRSLYNKTKARPKPAPRRVVDPDDSDDGEDYVNNPVAWKRTAENHGEDNIAYE